MAEWLRTLCSTLFFRLIIVFLLITVPVFIASFWLYYQAERITRQQLFELNDQQMRYSMEKFNEQVDMLFSLLQRICNQDDSITTVANLPESLTNYETGVILNSLHNQFYQYRMLSAFAEDVRVHFRSIGRTVTCTSAYNPLYQEEYDAIMAVPNLQGRLLLHNGHLLMVFTSTDNFNYAPDTKAASFFLVIELSNQAVLDYLVQSGADEDTLSAIYGYDGAIHLTQRNDALSREVVARTRGTLASGYSVLEVDGHKYLVLRQVSQATGLELLRVVDYSRQFTTLNLFRIWVIIFVVICLAAVLAFALTLHRMVRRPLGRLSKAFALVGGGDFSVTLDYARNDEFGRLYSQFNKMVADTQGLIERVYEQEILVQQADLKGLQSQINPHFLYNSLFIISVMARKGDMAFVEAFAEQLGQYFRFLVKNDRDMITLAEEVDYARLYTNIQAARFTGRMSFTIQAPPEAWRQRLVPRLILQPLIENAISHSLEKKTGPGSLTVRFEEEGRQLRIAVEDDGGGMTAADVERLRQLLARPASGGMSGLVNIQRRLAIQFGPQSGLRLELLPSGSLRAVIVINWETE